MDGPIAFLLDKNSYLNRKLSSAYLLKFLAFLCTLYGIFEGCMIFKSLFEKKNDKKSKWNSLNSIIKIFINLCVLYLTKFILYS